METNSNEGEVKEFVEKVSVVPTKDEELIENEEEIETPSSSSDEEKEPEQEIEEESTEENSEPEPEQEAETPEIKPEPKPVEGETPREKALRLEATRLKALLREQRREELFVKQPTEISKDEDLAGYDQEELKRFEMVATKLGFARKDEIVYQTTQDKLNTEFESFIEAHPEYSSENDKDGILWNQFKAEFSLYNPPKDSKTLRKVLNKVHNEIYGVQPAKNLSKINASQEKIKVASHTGASAGKTQRSQTQPPSGLRTDAMKGFSETELKELFG